MTPRSGELIAHGSRSRVYRILGVVLLHAILTSHHASAQTAYFVDAVGGSDANQGTSVTSAWKSLARVNAFPFLPGDNVSLKAGSVWNEALRINRSGTQQKPLKYTSFGIGPKPIIRNLSGDPAGSCVTISGSWVIVDGLIADSARSDGFLIGAGGNHNIIRNCEVRRAGIGISVSGRENLITKNYVHHLHMVVNDAAPLNDYGAIAIGLFNSRNEVSYNRMDSCYAPSYDYGEDGGAVEFYGTVDSCYVHHNWALNTNGFCEIGGGSSVGCIMAYNVYVTTRGQQCLTLHLSSTFVSTIQNLRFENNTLVCLNPQNQGWVLLGFVGAPTRATLTVRNNLMYMDHWGAVANYGTFTHDHNLYYSTQGTFNAGFPLAAGELVADPQFIDVGRYDLRLRSTSPAVNGGVPLGYASDFDNNPIPPNELPDIGAYEVSKAPSGDGGEGGKLPDTPILDQNFPNPFNPLTSIRYSIPASAFVTIDLFDIAGRLVRSLVNEEKSAGSHEVLLDADELASGTYVYRMRVGQFQTARKCLVVK